MQTDEQLEELAKKVAARMIALTTTLNEELNTHLRTSGWLASNPGMQNHIWLETAYLGCYVIQKKFTLNMSGPERGKFMAFFKKEFMSGVLGKIFKLGTIEEEGAGLMLEGEYDDKLKKYEMYQGRAAILFKSELQSFLTNKTDKIQPKAGSLFGLFGKPAPNSPLSDELLISIGESTVRLFDTATI